jgi:hypothetical protein
LAYDGNRGPSSSAGGTARGSWCRRGLRPPSTGPRRRRPPHRAAWHPPPPSCREGQDLGSLSLSANSLHRLRDGSSGGLRNPSSCKGERLGRPQRKEERGDSACGLGQDKAVTLTNGEAGPFSPCRPKCAGWGGDSLKPHALQDRDHRAHTEGGVKTVKAGIQRFPGSERTLRVGRGGTRHLILVCRLPGAAEALLPRGGTFVVRKERPVEAQA